MKPLPGKAYRGALEYTSRCALGEYLGFTPKGASGARCLAVGRVLSYARGVLHVLYYSPKTVSVRAPQSPYIGDEDALTESPLAFSVCLLAPSRGDRYRAS